MEKKLKHWWWLPLLFLLLQVVWYASGIVPPATDFEQVYFPNAINFTGIGVLPNDLVPDGMLNRFGTMPPGYSLFLGGLLFLGATKSFIFLVLAILGCLLWFVWCQIALRLGLNLKSIYIFSGLFLLHPLLSAMAPSLGSEMLFAVFLGGGILFLIQYITHSRILDIYLSLLSFCCATEVRVAAFGLLIIMSGWLLWARPRRFEVWIPAGLMTVLLYIQFSAPVYQYYLHRTMLDGLSRYPNNAAATDMVRMMIPATHDYVFSVYSGIREALQEHPMELFKLLGMRLGDALWAFDGGRHFKPLMAGQLILLLASIWYLRRKPERTWWIAIGCFLYFWFVAVGTLSICRYLLPVLPVLILLPVGLWQRHRP